MARIRISTLTYPNARRRRWMARIRISGRRPPSTITSSSKTAASVRPASASRAPPAYCVRVVAGGCRLLAAGCLMLCARLLGALAEKVRRTVEVFICHNGDLDFWDVGGVTCEWWHGPVLAACVRAPAW